LRSRFVGSTGIIQSNPIQREGRKQSKAKQSNRGCHTHDTRQASTRTSMYTYYSCYVEYLPSAKYIDWSRSRQSDRGGTASERFEIITGQGCQRCDGSSFPPGVSLKGSIIRKTESRKETNGLVVPILYYIDIYC
jgi:hypothetical protein